MFNTKKKYIASLMGASALYAPSAFSEGLVLDEIVVTATRVETSLQTTPVAVTALSSKELESTNIANLLDVAKYVPGLSIGNRSGSGAAASGVAIRGMGVDALDSSAAVGTYIDDIFFASSRGNVLGLMDVERVEVLRGPQGTLFGRNTIAGAIQYVTVDPGDELGGYVNLTVGSFDRTDVSAAIDLPVNDSFKLRVAAQNNDFGGYVYDENNDTDLGQDESTLYRVKALYEPNDRLSLNFKVEHIEQDMNGRPALIRSFNNNAQFVGLANDLSLITGNGPQQYTNANLSTNFNPGDFSTPGYNSPDFFEFEADILQANIEYEINDELSFKSITSSAEYSSRQAQDFDLATIDIIDVIAPPEELDVVTQEFQLSGSYDRINFTTGLYYYDSESVKDPGQIVILGPRGPQIPPSADGSSITTAESLSLYGQLSYTLTEKTTLNLGYRYTDEDTSAQILGAAPTEFNFTDSSPLVGIDYQLNDSTMIYGKISKGFRAGGFTASQSLPGGGLAFDPETATTTEIGARMELFDGRLRFNPTVFYTDWEDIQFLDFFEVVNPVTANSGDAEIFGIEIESKFIATENLVLTSAFAYLDAEYTRLNDLTKTIYPTGFTIFAPVTDAFNVPSIELDTPLPWTPEFKISVGADYSIELASGAMINTNVNYAWTDDHQTLSNVDAADVEAYGLLGARVSYTSADSKWDVSVYGNNLTNEFYLIGGQGYDTGFSAGPGQIDPGRPRELGVTVRYNF